MGRRRGFNAEVAEVAEGAEERRGEERRGEERRGEERRGEEEVGRGSRAKSMGRVG
ncbi:MAG: hypothetical protein U0638_07520 [Phycisphaerales bacterium]